MDFTGFHWDELVFTGYYQVSLSFAAFVLFFGPDGTAVTGCFFLLGFYFDDTRGLPQMKINQRKRMTRQKKKDMEEFLRAGTTPPCRFSGPARDLFDLISVVYGGYRMFRFERKDTTRQMRKRDEQATKPTTQSSEVFFLFGFTPQKKCLFLPTTKTSPAQQKPRKNAVIPS